MTRDEYLEAGRPTLPIEKNENDTEDALFMNTVLRPILKWQHEVIIMTLSAEENLQKQLEKTNTPRPIADQYLKTNRMLRQLLIGITLGCFTQAELTTYLKHKKELDKRIIAMITTRYLSTL